MIIKYNTPIEVTEDQYNKARKILSGVIAYRKEDGKYWVKILIMKYKKELEQILL